MQIISFEQNGTARLGLVREDSIVDPFAGDITAPRDMIELIANWDRYRARCEAASDKPPTVALDNVKILPPIARPGKILALGLNYADHVEEAGLEMPKVQTWFCKQPTSVNPPFAPIELPAASSALDHECELVFVIGKRCRNVPRERAQEAIFGYCVGNDVSVRDWQLQTPQWMLGKSFDTHAPFGPWITTADDIDPHTLDIRCLVNGEVRQSSNTRHFIFDCFEQIAHLSKAMTLEPGDIVFTGTCAGIGATRTPPVYLKTGDRVRVEIEALGAIEGIVVPGSGDMVIT